MVWRLQVCCTDSFRKDVEGLKQQLDSLLCSRQARDTGICQVSVDNLCKYWGRVEYLQSTLYQHSIYTGAAGAVRAVPGRVDPPDDDHVRGERAAAAQAEGRVQDHAARLHGHQHQQQSG